MKNPQVLDALYLEAPYVSSKQPSSSYDDTPRTTPFMPGNYLTTLSGSKQQEKELKKAIGFLNTHFKKIRVFVDNPVGGYGHQTSSLEVARQLRCCGYTGLLQIIWNEGNTAKFDILRNDFIKDMAKYPYPIEFQYDSEFAKTNKCLVGVTGGYDYIYNAYTDINAQYILILQPYQWLDKDRDIQRCVVKEEFFPEHKVFNFRLNTPLVLNSQFLGHHYKNPTPRLLEPFIAESLKNNPNIYPVINEVLQSTKSDQMNLQMAYYISRKWYPYILFVNLVNGLLTARLTTEKLQKRNVIFVIDNFPNWEKIEIIDNLMKFVPKGQIGFCNVDEYDKFKALASTPITVCFSPFLPEKLFDLIMQTSNLPPIFEGANNTNKRLCMAENLPAIPFISFDDANTQFLSAFDNISDKGKQKCKDMLWSLMFTNFSSQSASKINYDFIAKYISEALDPNSLLNQYFLGCARKVINPNNNLTTAGIIELVKTIKKDKNLLCDSTLFPSNSMKNKPDNLPTDFAPLSKKLKT